MKESDPSDTDEASNSPSEDHTSITAKAFQASSQARHAYFEERDPEKAREIYGEALILFRSLGDDLMVAKTQYTLAEVLSSLAAVHTGKGEHKKAGIHLYEALQIARDLGDTKGTAETLRTLAKVWLRLEMREKAASQLGKAADLLRGNGPHLMLADTLLRLGQLSDGVGERGEAEALYTEAVLHFRRANDKKALADTLNNLGVVAGRLKRFDEAEEAFSEALETYYAIGDENGRACANCNLGVVLESRAKRGDAQMLFRESLESSSRAGNGYVIAASLNNHGVTDSLMGNRADAVKRFEKALESTDDLEFQAEQERELIVAVLENLSRIKIAANESLDDLCEYVDGRSVEVDVLEGWRLMRRGQSLASKGLWNEAWMMTERGERAVGCSGELAPTRFVWSSIGLNGWVGPLGASRPSRAPPVGRASLRRGTPPYRLRP
jgi:tetratricopeptide (TPR) repeat protein